MQVHGDRTQHGNRAPAGQLLYRGMQLSGRAVQRGRRLLHCANPRSGRAHPHEADRPLEWAVHGGVQSGVLFALSHQSLASWPAAARQSFHMRRAQRTAGRLAMRDLRRIAHACCCAHHTMLRPHVSRRGGAPHARGGCRRLRAPDFRDRRARIRSRLACDERQTRRGVGGWQAADEAKRRG